jgi:GMP synthase (glutamine-hydrolysing)
MRALVAVNHDICPIGMLASPLEEAGVELVYWSAESEPSPRNLTEFVAVVALGGGANPDEDDVRPWLADERRLLRKAVEQERFVLGVCLGGQLLAQALGASAVRLAEAEIGWRPLRRQPAGAADELIGPASPDTDVFEWHSCRFTLPARGVLLAGGSENVQAFRHGGRVWGFQSHIEADEEIVLGWIKHYGGAVLSDAGVDEVALREETSRRASAYRSFATSLGRQFADAIVEHSAPGPRPFV